MWNKKYIFIKSIFCKTHNKYADLKKKLRYHSMVILELRDNVKTGLET